MKADRGGWVARVWAWRLRSGPWRRTVGKLRSRPRVQERRFGSSSHASWVDAPGNIQGLGAVMVIRLLALAFALATQAATSGPAVVFVCEHGAAKSVIATAYFNKLAAERGLPFRATFRGTAPQEELSVRAVEGLKADGLSI